MKRIYREDYIISEWVAGIAMYVLVAELIQLPCFGVLVYMDKLSIIHCIYAFLYFGIVFLVGGLMALGLSYVAIAIVQVVASLAWFSMFVTGLVIRSKKNSSSK